MILIITLLDQIFVQHATDKYQLLSRKPRRRLYYAELGVWELVKKRKKKKPLYHNTLAQKRLLSWSSDFVITRVITDRIGRNEVQIPINHNNTFSDTKD